MNSSEFSKQYYELDQFIGGIFATEADFDQFDIDILLDKYFKPISISRYKEKVLPQAHEILAMEPFPEELIGEIANQWSPIETRKQWLTEVVEKLEARIAEAEAAQKSANTL